MKKLTIFVLFITLLPCTVISQEKFRVMFYNVENLFDTIKEPNKNDGEYLPASKKHWNTKKYRQKLTNISKVITAAGEWSTPALVGMCEVENERVMNDLTKNTPLKSQQYRYIMTNCADRRGIDIALLYQPDQFRLLGYKAYKIRFSSPQKVTRDLLHVTGKVKSGDTLDVFVCHYPSRIGGEKSSESGRIRVSEVLREKADSLYRIRKCAHIVIMGDFNDEPSNKSIYTTLGARPYEQQASLNDKKLHLYNLFYPFEKQERKGSHKYQGHWGMLDQMIVSESLLKSASGICTSPANAHIFDADFLLTEDKSKGGKRPKRTFFGMQYEAGFSDHLPVITDFYISLP